MAVVIAWSRVHSPCGSTISASLALVASAVVGGALTGLVVNGIGALVSATQRPFLVVAVAGCAIAATIVRKVPWQRDAETPRSWLRYQDWRTACLNGLFLGAGLFTRIGTWGLYSLAVLALGYTHPLQAALLLGTYGGLRAGLSCLLSIGSVRSIVVPRIAKWSGQSGCTDRGVASALLTVAALYPIVR